MPELVLSLLGGGWGLLKRLFGWMARQDPRELVLIGLLLLVGLLLTLRADAIHDRDAWKSNAAAKQARLERICGAVRTAGDDRRFDCDRTEQQIRLFGEALHTMTAALARQTTAVLALGQQTARERDALAVERHRAATRARRVDATAQALAASARSSERQTRPCEPSKALRESWR